jgi:hypothetical protein
VCDTFLDLRDLLVWLLDESQHLESVCWRKQFELLKRIIGASR